MDVSTENPIFIENICRTCMNEENELIPLFNTFLENISDKNLAEILETCIDLKVEQDDGLPEQICSNCVKDLNTTYLFKLNSLKVYEILQEKCVPLSLSENLKLEPQEEFPINKMAAPEPEPKKDISKKHNFKSKNKEKAIEKKCVIQIKNEPEVFETDFDEMVLENEILIDSDALKKRYFCEKCGKTMSRNGFFNHRKRDCVKIFECKDCELEFENRKSLRDHLRSHKNLLECKFCPMVFRSRYGLQYHLKRHEGVENYHCPFENCVKKFAIQRALDKHILTHSKEKSFLCSKCGEGFRTRDTLHYHIKTHDGNKPHLCTHCGKAFKQICHLKTHTWVHTGIKPYKCDKCQKCFTRISCLKKHLKRFCGSLENENYKVV